MKDVKKRRGQARIELMERHLFVNRYGQVLFIVFARRPRFDLIRRDDSSHAAENIYIHAHISYCST
jgi:hypothetical protein